MAGTVCFQPNAHKPQAFVALFWTHSGQLPCCPRPPCLGARHLNGAGRQQPEPREMLLCCCMASFGLGASPLACCLASFGLGASPLLAS